MTDSPLAWARQLPADEIRGMLLELSRTAEQAFGGDPYEVLAALDTVLAAWRSTAQVHAEPGLCAALTTPIDLIDLIDLVDAPRPEAAWFVFAGCESGSHDCPVRYDGYGGSLACSCTCHVDVPAYPRTDAEYAALPVLNLDDFHAQEGQ